MKQIKKLSKESEDWIFVQLGDFITYTERLDRRQIETIMMSELSSAATTHHTVPTSIFPLNRVENCTLMANHRARFISTCPWTSVAMIDFGKNK